MDQEKVVVKEPGLCRCCHSQGCFQDLNQEYVWMDKTEVYGNILKETFGVKISLYGSRNGINGSKKLICQNCIKVLRQCYKFRNQVLANEQKLAATLGPVTEAILKLCAANEKPQYYKIVKREPDLARSSCPDVAESAHSDQPKSLGDHKPIVFCVENLSRSGERRNVDPPKVSKPSEPQSAKMLIFLQNGEQQLITFTLPKESCTLQDILEQAKVPISEDTHIQCMHNRDSEIDYFVAVGKTPRIEDLLAKHSMLMSVLDKQATSVENDVGKARGKKRTQTTDRLASGKESSNKRSRQPKPRSRQQKPKWTQLVSRTFQTVSRSSSKIQSGRV